MFLASRPTISGIIGNALRTATRGFSAVPFRHQTLFESANPQKIEYKKITSDGVRVEKVGDRDVLVVEPQALTSLARTAMHDISHLLRTSHLKQLRSILDDPEASENDKIVAFELLKNASIAAQRVLPSCQDTGTAIVLGKKGQNVITLGDDEEALSLGVYKAYTETNLRYSQVSPLNMFDEVNTKTNLPAQIDLYATKGDEYKFLFMAKGGGSANKTFLYQKTKALLNEASLMKFLEDELPNLGTSACPPYHLAIVIGGLSAELNLKTVKLASARYYDDLPTTGNDLGRAFRDLEWEQKILKLTREIGIGAQFGGKYFCHDVRVIRLPRHGASCPVGVGVSCSADRQAIGKITKDGVFIEKMEEHPEQFLPEVSDKTLGDNAPIKIDLNKPMSEIRSELSKYPIRTKVSLSGPLVVARDIAHAKMLEVLKSTGDLPQFIKDHPVYYAGPAKTPEGMPSGSFGPTTAGRMDSYVDEFQKVGGSFVMLAKGNRSKAVTKACKTHGGFYLGSIGGPAAALASANIKDVKVLAWPELGMEAVWKIEVEDFPAFVVVDDKGNDFYAKWSH